jgi:hypothetical protein
MPSKTCIAQNLVVRIKVLPLPLSKWKGGGGDGLLEEMYMLDGWMENAEHVLHEHYGDGEEDVIACQLQGSLKKSASREK